MISGVLAKTENSPVLNSLLLNNTGVSEHEEKVKKDLDGWINRLEEIKTIELGDKLGQNSTGNYYLFKNGWLQKGWRMVYGENREYTFQYLDKDFTEFMRFLDEVIKTKNTYCNWNMRLLIKEVTQLIDDITPGLYNLKKTYPEEKKLVAKIDSIIITLIDFKDKTRVPQNTILRHRALSE